jgi:hypothetical protein
MRFHYPQSDRSDQPRLFLDPPWHDTVIDGCSKSEMLPLLSVS